MLSGHLHNYERFAEQAPEGVAAPGRAIREFVVGAGGGKFRHCLDCTIIGTTKEATVG